MGPIKTELSRPKEDIYNEVILRKGKEHQIKKFLEECREAIEAGEKYLDNTDDEEALEKFLYEAADVKITSEQIPMIFSAEVFIPYYIKKLIRLDLRLRNDFI